MSAWRFEYATATVTRMNEASPAATVVLVRDTPAGIELLLTERHGKLGFAGGAMVFPGGKVDPGDLEVARDPALATGFDGLGDIDAAARVTAARETLEEVGVLLSDGPALDAAALAGWRARFASTDDEAGTYAAFLADTGHRADAARLTPFANWIPPEGLHRRFDTLFYVAPVEAGIVVTPDGSEAVAAHWSTAAAAVALAERDEINVIFPTRRNLERLAQYPSVAALLDRLAGTPPIRIQPEIVTRDGEQWLTIPAGCDYPVTEERLTSAKRG